MLSILICDDSLVARKQVAKCLPQDMEVAIHFAKHGEEAIQAICQGKGDLLLLDLNMPVLDGYGTLKQISEQNLATKTIVISGDIQAEAKARVAELGAIDFIQKPVKPEVLENILSKHGYIATPTQAPENTDGLDEVIRDCYQEVVNVAMGQAGAHLAKIMDVFVKLPIPNVT